MAKLKKLTPEQEAVIQAATEARNTRRRNFRKELVGIFAGIGLALAIGALVPAVRENYSLGLVVLWGGAIGGVVTSLERFEKAGAALTKTENRVLNYAIGLGIPVMLIVWLFISK